MSATKTYAWTGKAPNWSTYQRTQKTQTFDAVKSAGPDGITREKICTVTDLPKQRVWFYLSELRRAGLIKRLGDAIDPSTMGPLEAKVFALNALENALVANAKVVGVTPEVDKAFVRYNKIKSLALGAKTDGEMNAALRHAMIDLVKLVF